MGVTAKHQTLLEPNNNNNDPHHQPHATPTGIVEFYRNAHVLLTGATGFVGKAVVEKLLRTCDSLSAIYVLIRSKRGVAAERRLRDELLSSAVFARIREKDASLLRKVRVIEGDVTLPQLGLSPADRRHLVERIDIIIHAAASVRFTEPLRAALVLNTLGTRRMLELALDMRRTLRAFVHVSTAYSNSDRAAIAEVVYAPPTDPQRLLHALEHADNDDALRMLERDVIGQRHPNTYTFTKALAETLVQQHADRLPVAIVRPSIVTNAWKEPFSGWIDHATGVVGIMMEIGRGSIQSVIGNKDALMDIVPVDVVCNTLIAVAWHTAARRTSTDDVTVYNCTSGGVNQMRWGTWGELTIRSARLYPTQYLSWYPQLTYRTNRLAHFIAVVVLQRAPALLADVLLMCQRRKPMMLNFCKRVEKRVQVGEYFALHEFAFDVTNLEALKRDVRAAGDADLFELDMSDGRFDWTAYNEACMVGIRQQVLKDDLSSLPQARRTLMRFYWLKRVLQLVSIYVFLKMTIL